LVKFSRTWGYALLALVVLAERGEQPFLGASPLAEAHRLPARFLSIALKQLIWIGVLQSVRGSAGGYRLARPPKDLTLLEIVQTVDGPLRHAVPTLTADGNRQLDRRLEVVTEAAAELVREQLPAVTVAYLVKGRQ
jgi:Rrf2 family protein